MLADEQSEAGATDSPIPRMCELRQEGEADPGAGRVLDGQPPSRVSMWASVRKCGLRIVAVEAQDLIAIWKTVFLQPETEIHVSFVAMSDSASVRSTLAIKMIYGEEHR